MAQKYSCVFYETTEEKAKSRLAELRRRDKKHLEIKAYILPEGPKFRVLRQILVGVSKEKRA